MGRISATITSTSTIGCCRRIELKFLLLLDDADSVVGLMLVYDGSMVQLRGSHVAVEFMLDNLKSNRVMSRCR